MGLGPGDGKPATGTKSVKRLGGIKKKKKWAELKNREGEREGDRHKVGLCNVMEPPGVSLQPRTVPSTIQGCPLNRDVTIRAQHCLCIAQHCPSCFRTVPPSQPRKGPPGNAVLSFVSAGECPYYSSKQSQSKPQTVLIMAQDRSHHK